MHIGFIMSTEVGLRTQYLNWKDNLTPDLGIDPEWIVINWWKEGGMLERLPGVPRSVKTRLRCRMEVKEGVKEGLSHGPFDALFIAALSVMHLDAQTLARQPYFLTTDVTPLQLQAFGDLYGKYPSRFAAVERRKHETRRALMQNAAMLFPWSHWAAGSMVEDYGVDPDRIQVMPPGINIDKWACPPRPLDAPVVNILFVGGDFHRKGGDLLLQWAQRTSAQNWKLHLVTREKIEPPADNIFVYNDLNANDPTLMRLYQEAHIFALPTRGDCYSLAGMEAMAAGLPVILSETGGTGDIIRDGETGYLIGPGDGDGLIQRLEHLLAHPELRATMGQAARRDAESRYDVRKNIRRTVELIRERIGK